MKQGDKSRRHLRVLTSDGKTKIRKMSVVSWKSLSDLSEQGGRNKEGSDFEAEQRAKT